MNNFSTFIFIMNDKTIAKIIIDYTDYSIFENLFGINLDNMETINFDDYKLNFDLRIKPIFNTNIY